MHILGTKYFFSTFPNGTERWRLTSNAHEDHFAFVKYCSISYVTVFREVGGSGIGLLGTNPHVEESK